MKPLIFLWSLCIALCCAPDETLAQGDAATLSQRVQALERAGRFAEAIPLYEKWQRLAPDQAPIVRGYARALTAIGAHQRVVAPLVLGRGICPGEQKQADGVQLPVVGCDV